MRILQIESDQAARDTTESLLKIAGFNIFSADCGEEGIELGKIYDYDAITTGLKFSGCDGFDVIRQLRTAKVKTPIIVISAIETISAKLKSFSLGADDYLTKPFDGEELVARLNALVRRSRGIVDSEFMIGELLINLTRKTIYVKGAPVRVSGMEYKMLELLCLRKGMIVTKEMFFNHLYGGVDEPCLKIIDVYICKLRKKLSQYTDGNGFVETLWGRGYRISENSVKTDLSPSAMWMEPERAPSIAVS